ncbi:hypothetical protein [Bacillus taeanensis]|uniref:Uncharacterized protein n=1 Tax=Bacillus taeanensis TaxID=273032 RepID=A0A366XVF9_9BACI|nr:hypothetical protein [Bacillus taeanensis]RBW69636.1 hypothetical protein DS031_10445 [Bacillus taeanensis]
MRSKLLTKLWKEEDFNELIQGVPDAFLEAFPNIRMIHEVVQAFLSLVRNRNHSDLETWISNYQEVNLSAIQSFINGIKADIDAVKHALY